MSLNRVVLVGRLTKDPDLRFTPNGVAVCNFTLAVNRPFKQEGQQQADFIQIQVWRKPAENAAQYLKKGNLAGVDGRWQTRNFEGQDGKRVFMNELVADSVQFLEPKNIQTSSNMGDYQDNSYNPSNSNGPIDIHDDELPF